MVGRIVSHLLHSDMAAFVDQKESGKAINAKPLYSVSIIKRNWDRQMLCLHE